MNHLNLSVVIVTLGSRDTLQRALDSILRNSSSSCSCEIVIVYNGSGRDIPERVRLGHGTIREQGGKIIREVFEKKAGSARAMNRGLDEAGGELVAFTDDDVEVAPGWLEGIWKASQRFPEHVLFCGPITLSQPGDAPGWLQKNMFVRRLFGEFAPNLPEGSSTGKLMPMGANFAVRTSKLDGLRFRLDLGPSEENGPLLGEDTIFFEELHGRYGILSGFGGCVYVPTAGVTHYVQSSKVSFMSIMGRLYQMGRTHMLFYHQPTHIYPQLYPMRPHYSTEEARFTSGIQINFYLGQLHEAMRCEDRSCCLYLERVLAMLNVNMAPEVISADAQRSTEAFA